MTQPAIRAEREDIDAVLAPSCGCGLTDEARSQ
jgi:hypothetical protein